MKKIAFLVWVVILIATIYPPQFFNAQPNEVKQEYTNQDSVIESYKHRIQDRLDAANQNNEVAKKYNQKAEQARKSICKSYYLSCKQN